MGLTISNSKGTTTKDGIFINESTILAVEVVENPFPNSQYPAPDLAIKVKFDVGASFEPEDIIAGNFKKDEVDGTIKGLGSAFKVADFFLKAMDADDLELTEDNKIPEEWLTNVIGKKVLRLTYCYRINMDNTMKYKNWTRYGDANKSPDILKKGFVNAVDRGYIKDYQNPSEKEEENLPNMFPEEVQTTPF